MKVGDWVFHTNLNLVARVSCLYAAGEYQMTNGEMCGDPCVGLEGGDVLLASPAFVVLSVEEVNFYERCCALVSNITKEIIFYGRTAGVPPEKGVRLIAYALDAAARAARSPT